MCQSIAREYGPKSIHVAHVIVDGLIESDTALEYLGMPKASRFPDGSVGSYTPAFSCDTEVQRKEADKYGCDVDYRLYCHRRWQRRGFSLLNSISRIGRLRWISGLLANIGDGVLHTNMEGQSDSGKASDSCSLAHSARIEAHKAWKQSHEKCKVLKTLIFFSLSITTKHRQATSLR